MALILTMAALFGVMWFLLIRPQQRRQQAQRDLLASLHAGQEILIAGGIFGTIVDVDIEEVVVEVAPGVNVRVDKRAVATVIEVEEVDDEEPEADEAPAGELAAETPREAERS
jgi:preprotein translocase subunit YajC